MRSRKPRPSLEGSRAHRILHHPGSAGERAPPRQSTLCSDSYSRAPRHVTIQISDNGVGMEIFSPRGNGEPVLGIGISGMRERVKQLDGEFFISSSLGIGATIQIVLPLDSKEGTK
jgi:signal transduction histidine kinase